MGAYESDDAPSFARFRSRVVHLLPKPHIAQHERFLQMVRGELDHYGYPKTQTSLNVPRELMDSLYNPESELFPSLGALMLLLEISDVPDEARQRLRARWESVMSAYRRRGQLSPDSVIITGSDVENNATKTLIANVVMESGSTIGMVDAMKPAKRPTTRRQPLPVLPDAEGFEDLRPEPLLATTVPQFLEAMRQFHVWSGEESFRELSRIAHGAFGASTLSETLSQANSTRLPSLRVVTAFIKACGGSDDDLIRWTTAWRVIRLSQTSNGKARSPQLRAVDAS